MGGGGGGNVILLESRYPLVALGLGELKGGGGEEVSASELPGTAGKETGIHYLWDLQYLPKVPTLALKAALRTKRLMHTLARTWPKALKSDKVRKVLGIGSSVLSFFGEKR